MRLRCVDHVIAGVPCCIKQPVFGKRCMWWQACVKCVCEPYVYMTENVRILKVTIHAAALFEELCVWPVEPL